jgi:hypothetical protein
MFRRSSFCLFRKKKMNWTNQVYTEKKTILELYFFFPLVFNDDENEI